jgi:hypothetical protein
MEEIDVEDLKQVNTFSRIELVKEKTRELTVLASAFAKGPDAENLHRLFAQWDALAMDWVYSDRLEYGGSFPDAKAKEIESEIAIGL